MKQSTLLLAVALGSTLLTGCGGGYGSDGGYTPPPTSSAGQITLKLGDAAVDGVSKVVIRVKGVEISNQSGTPTTITFATSKDIDLLTLQNGTTATLLDGYTVPAGQYGSVRLLVDADFDNVFDSYVETPLGQLEIRIPSGSESGLKLVQGFTVPAGGTASFTIDFDVRKSLVRPNGQPGYFLKPALRLIDNAQSGVLSGSVAGTIISANCLAATPPYYGAVYAYTGAGMTPVDIDGAAPDPVATAKVSLGSDGKYSYRFPYMAPGDYTVAYTCGTDVPDAPDSLTFIGTSNTTVVNAQTTTKDF